MEHAAKITTQFARSNDGSMDRLILDLISMMISIGFAWPGVMLVLSCAKNHHR